jgi:hypothetical protein
MNGNKLTTNLTVDSRIDGTDQHPGLLTEKSVDFMVPAKAPGDSAPDLS